MRTVLVCGSRSWTDLERIQETLQLLKFKFQVIHGGAKGADLLAHAACRRLSIPVKQIFLPEYEKHGKQAPAIRNQQMVDLLEEGDLVIAFLRDNSPGTVMTIKFAQQAGFVPVVVQW